MSDLTDFLLARIAEDEAAAYDVSDVARHTVPGYANGLFEVGDEDWAGGLRVDPARMLAECEAKRRIVEEHPDYGGYGESCATCADGPEDLRPWPCPTLCALAAVYADHPDYREEWRP